MASLRDHMKSIDPLSRPEWMELNLPVADVAKWASTDNRFATNDGRFAYMGRVHYHKLRSLISQLVNERKYSYCTSYEQVQSPSHYNDIIGNILVVGPVGTGKSHIVAAAASDFTEEFSRNWSVGEIRRRVVAIMDCGLLQQDRAFLILRDALFVAYADDEANLEKLRNYTTLEHLATFCEATEAQLLWIFDQWQCIEGQTTENVVLKNILFRMCCHHCMVRVVSASCELVEKTFYAGQPPAKLFMWNEGLEVQFLFLFLFLKC
jgi:predicted AAA+ superfamily ATPase